MPATNVIFYKEDDETVPALDWIDRLPAKAQDKCQARLQRLADSGHELRRPIADLLRDGIHELRLVDQGVNYRILYFFHGQTVAVVSHGLAKERKVPPKEINRAIERKREFEEEPRKHAHEEA